jgi:uncharacterized protein (DUF2384 family)
LVTIERRYLTSIEFIMTTEASQHADEMQIMAADVFGSPEKAQQWLSSHNLALGCRPCDLLNTEAGASDVRRVLIAIAAGGTV